MDIQISTTAQLAQLAPLFNKYRIFYKQPSDLQRAEKFLLERIKNKDSVIFLAIASSGDAMGFTQLYPSFSSVSTQRIFILNDLYVSSKHRNKGVGKALLDYAKQYAKAHGAKGITLETNKDNPAQALYETLGWKKDIAVFHYTWKVNSPL